MERRPDERIGKGVGNRKRRGKDVSGERCKVWKKRGGEEQEVKVEDR